MMAAPNTNLKHKPMLLIKEKIMKKDCVAESDQEEELPAAAAPEDDKRKRLATAAAKKPADGLLMKTCQAEKCSADLTDAKAYHRRHKVCEHHAKAQVALVAGIRQRFCQQCSRFHEVSEFDEAKRSCRRRLAGHNERRRKNPAEQAEGSASSRNKGGGNAAASAQMKDMVCGKVDDRGRIHTTVQENASYKHFHVR